MRRTVLSVCAHPFGSRWDGGAGGWLEGARKRKQNTDKSHSQLAEYRTRSNTDTKTDNSGERSRTRARACLRIIVIAR